MPWIPGLSRLKSTSTTLAVMGGLLGLAGSMQAADPTESMKLHEELTAIQNELHAAETRWTELQEQLESF